MWKQFIASLIASILVVGVIAASLSYLLTPILPFWLSFFALSVLVWSSITLVKSYFNKKQEAAELEILAKLDFEDERNKVTITCPCQQNTFNMQVYPSVENEYTCNVCKNRFLVNVTTEPVLQTDPVNLDNAYKIFQTLVDKEKENVNQEL